MWYLLKHGDGKRIYLKPCKEIVIGRKKGTILISDDESLSKLHASICVQPKLDIERDEPVSTCTVKDEGSKYGTYVIKDDQKIEVTKEGYNLSSQDVIRFGLKNSFFTVVYEPIITVISNLNDEDKSMLQHLMDSLDGFISSERINNCTHLTVSKATLTEKVTWALVSAIPIVTVAYWTEVERAVANNEELPKPDRFIPALSESLIDKKKLLLHPDNRRKTLFKNLIFVHFSINQYKIYGKLVHLAGGKAVLYTKKPLTPRELCSPNVIVLQYPGDEATQSTNNIIPEYDVISNILQKNRRKMIAESEIPLAILHCSVEKYCNPKFRFSQLLKRSETNVELSEVIVLDTQDVDVVSSTSNSNNIKKSKNAVEIIPETKDSFSSRDLTNRTFSQSSSLDLMCSTPITKNNKSNSIFNSNISTPRRSKQNAEHPKENPICIPETCNSSLSNAMSLDRHSFPHSSISMDDGQNENVKSLTPSTVDSNKPRIREVIRISEDDDVLARIHANTSLFNESSKKVVSKTRDTQSITNSGSIQSNTNKENEHLNEVTVSKKTDTVSKTKSDPAQSNLGKISEHLTEITLFKKTATANKGNEPLSKMTMSEKTDTLTKTKNGPAQPNEDLNEVTVLKETDTVLKTNTGSTQANANKADKRLIESPVSTKSDTLSKTNDSAVRKAPKKFPEVRIKENIVVVFSSDDESADGTVSSTVQPSARKDNTSDGKGIDSHKCDTNDRSKLKRPRFINDSYDDEPATRKYKQSTEERDNLKRNHLYDSTTNKSAPEVSRTNRLERENILSTNVNQQYKVTINFKRFKKAPVIIPKERIGLDRMYVG